MRCQVEKNKEILRNKIEQLCEKPVTYESAEHLILCHKAHKIMCELYGHREHEPARSWDPIEGHTSKSDTEPMMSRVAPFDRQMAMEWTSGMVNADGTKGPHWTMEETNKLHAQHSLTCPKEEFWAVMNALYSDYCEALRESAASTPETYVRLAKAWLDDKDAVPDKAGAYYMYVVEHR